MSEFYRQKNEPIALVGSGCRFPGNTNNPSQLWDLLKTPRDLVKKVPKDRFNIDGYYHPDGTHHGRTNAQYAYFLDQDPYAFDASFFSIPPNEVDTIDPQQRLLLETVYDGISAAGLRLEDLRGSPTAVYVGLMQRDHLDSSNADPDAITTYAATGAAASIMSNRISYAFGWHGPSETIDTACSSSLVAVHHAIQQLRSGSSQVAVAAGSNLILSPIPFVTASKLNMFSPTGRSRMWDAAADGYARGEGIAAVVLKTLKQAIADGDNIECVIRESGVNQDGRTPGITMPSSEMQRRLIEQVYRDAGLDIMKAEDRCQYFEAHGTGTPAGDPQEACAIASAFFGNRERDSDEDPLYVGSVKTVIGHTESTAGVAGLLKAAQMIQHGLLVPNMLFEELNPRVAPFYSDLEVVTRPRVWPVLKYDQPRRVSVNSFGFGGTNAHVIVESYVPAPSLAYEEPETSSLIPFVLSASSTTSLRAVMDDVGQCIKQQPGLQLRDLAWTLMKKRSNLQFRYTAQARTMDELSEVLERDAPLVVDGKSSVATVSDLRAKPHLLGIFTGQGAQWPAMGKRLVSNIAYARRIIQELDDSLQSLPPKYRPDWTLIDQLCLEGEESNVNDAVYSQPLCCAVQIVLAKVLTSVGIRFKVVVGHSSGEIACAFAAGFISARQAIRIAYLRGLISTCASSPEGRDGAMIAAGTSFDDALDLCSLDAFQGRLSVAASNAPESVTLSGDKDAVLEVQEVLHDESRFARILKVDKAYHSHHMKPCAEPYLAALKACECNEGEADAEHRATWISSVHDGRIMSPNSLTAEYWVENLLSPVLFSFAIEMAVVKHMPLDMCVEVGAHAALRNPTLQTLKNCIESYVPYTGCMERGRDDIAAFSSCLGYIWSHFGSTAFDIDGLYGAPGMDVSKLLPTYPWDHTRCYRKESRAVRRLLHAERPHLLLGRQAAHSIPTSPHWQNFIRLRDIDWLDGHALQGQVVFPGAGFVVMAMEAALQMEGSREICLLEVLDLEIEKAITFENEQSMVEITTSLELIATQATIYRRPYYFTIDSCLSKETELSRSVRGIVSITLGSSYPEALPVALHEPAHLKDIDIDRFYDMLDRVGYNYTKQFRGITALQRGDSKAHGTINFDRLIDGGHDFIMHPSTLDVAFQSMIAAFTGPADGRIKSLLVPTGIGRIALNPWTANQISKASNHASFTATCVASGSTSMQGDIEVFDQGSGATLLHVEGIGFKPTTPPSAADDHHMYTKWHYGPLTPDALFDEPEKHATIQDKRDVEIIERVTYWYIRRFLSEVTAQDKEKATFHFTQYIHWCEHVLAETRAGRNTWWTSGWESDTKTEVERMISENQHLPFIRLIHRIGDEALDIFRNDLNAFDLLDHDGLVTEFYTNQVSYGQSYYYYQKILEQVTHRYPDMDVLEVGAGTAGATRLFLNHEDLPFRSYTFTDISRNFFEPAAKEFERHAGKMHFQPFDARRPPAEQGFKPHSYDLIAASNVLHATPDLLETLTNVRSLLKPGGKLITIEIIHSHHTRIGFIFGLFPDWWAGHDDGRILEPFVHYDQWDKVLKASGFSGIDSRSLDPDSKTFPSGVFLSHAVDDFVNRIDSPLTTMGEQESSAPLVVVGGSSSKTASIVGNLNSVRPGRSINTVPSIRAILDFDLRPGTTFVVLSELDEQFFTVLDDEKFEALQSMFNAAQHVLWVTESAWLSNAEQAMSIGLLRSLRWEYPDLHVQMLDVDNITNVEPKFLLETMLRLEYGARWEEYGMSWTQEPELYLSGGKVLVPRLKRDTSKNDRLNSGHRIITANLDPTKNKLSLHQREGQACFQVHVEQCSSVRPDESLVTVLVSQSLAKAVRVGAAGFFYLVQGKTVPSGENVIAFCETNASQVQVSALQLVYTDHTTDLLSAIFVHIVSQTLLFQLPKGSKVLVLDPPDLFLESLEDEALRCEVSLVFASTRIAPAVGQYCWIQLHEKETQRSLGHRLPTNVSVFYDFTRDRSPSGLSRRIANCLPTSCAFRDATYLFRDVATVLTEAAMESCTSALVRSRHTNQHHRILEKMTIVAARDVLIPRHDPPINFVVDWTQDSLITSQVRPVETDNIFSNEKTYLLVGLAGDMGRSLARFMVEHGARHLVLSSRNPQIDQRWIDDMGRCGGEIMVLPMDVSSKDAVDQGLAKIRASMPRIGGVAFGPLLLADVMFKNMELSAMELVLAPKVTGARLLNERLSDPADPLDFFVMFSSIVLVVGNPGQAAYSSANAYLNAVARQRRARGMAGSTIDIGAVIGVGYVSRTGREEEVENRKYLADEIKEWELHALFAEAVVAGRNGTVEDSEIVDGMAYLDEKDRDRIPWYNDPRFARLHWTDRQTTATEATGNTASVRVQLLEATSSAEAREIILSGIAERIRGALMFAPGDDLNLATPLVDQGVDSLSAVTVASWFSKNLKVDIPLLKILGGASAADLVDEAVSRLNADLVPLVDHSAVQLTAEPVPSILMRSTDTTDVASESSSSAGVTGHTSTPASRTSEVEDGYERVGPLSIVQEYTLKEMQLPLDASTFNTTIGMYMQGHLDLTRLAEAFGQALQRNDIFRVCFTSKEASSDKLAQAVLRSPRNSFQAIQVADKSEAAEAFRRLQQEKFDISQGQSLKVVNYSWTTTDHLLIIAYHRLVGDGWTTTHLFNEASQLYSGLPVEAAPSYVDFAIRQRQQLLTGGFENDIGYWTKIFQTIPSRLPTLRSAVQKAPGPTMLDWASHDVSTRLSYMLAARIKDRSRKQNATPMHFYLAAYNILLARLTGAADFSIGVADAGRASLVDQVTMGYFSSYIPMRLPQSPDSDFNNAVDDAKEQMRAGLLHSAVALPVLLESLGLLVNPSNSDPTSQAPLFQAVFDYKQGQTETGSIGEAKIVDTDIPRAGTPYDITLQIGDDLSRGEPVLTIKLRKDQHGLEVAETVMQEYLSVLNTFARNPSLKIKDAVLVKPSGISTTPVQH